MTNKKIIAVLIAILLISCSDDEPSTQVESERNFKMGFTSWPFGPQLQDVNDTYSFIETHGDIYAEHIDNNIPWKAWINDEDLPPEFINEIDGKANRKISGKELLLSVSLLRSDRSELAFDFDGSIPEYEKLDDSNIQNAYFKHISYLVDKFQPDYLVIAIEVNELRLRSPDKWDSYKNLITKVKSMVKEDYPNLKIAESISLHNLFEPDVANPEDYIQDIISHTNQNDFAAISFYPFLKNLSSKAEFQEALDFLHSRVDKPITFVETAHIAEDLVIPNLNVSINSNENEQKHYLETLFENAETQDYKFIIWWAHRDFDALWETFPADIKDLGQIWRDTGLLDENGRERPAFSVWQEWFLE